MRQSSSLTCLNCTVVMTFSLPMCIPHPSFVTENQWNLLDCRSDKYEARCMNSCSCCPAQAAAGPRTWESTGSLTLEDEDGQCRTKNLIPSKGRAFIEVSRR